MAGLEGGLVVLSGGWGGGSTDTFLSCTQPHLTRYFSREHINLSPIFFSWDFIDTDTNVCEL